MIQSGGEGIIYHKSIMVMESSNKIKATQSRSINDINTKNHYLLTKRAII